MAVFLNVNMASAYQTGKNQIGKTTPVQRLGAI